MISKDMNLSVNGHSQVPPGFRFHPTEEELLHYYLRKKVASEKIDLDVIRDVDLNKHEPWDIQERCKIGSTPQNDWYFFSHKDKKYPTGTRTNRATAAGFWKATGRDKVIYTSSRRIGMRKTLVFYMGRAPHGQKSDWIMHEYRLDDHNSPNDKRNNHDHASASCQMQGESMQEDGWVVCRVFTKKYYQRATASPKMSCRPPHMQVQRDSNLVLDQILAYMGKNCKQENDHTRLLEKDTSMMPFLHPLTQFDEDMQTRDKFLHLPGLDRSPASYKLIEEMLTVVNKSSEEQMSDWVTLDRLVTSQLNGCAGGGGGGHLSDMIFDQTASGQLTCCISSDDPNSNNNNNNMAAAASFEFSHEHNDEGALLLPEFPLNHFSRSLSSNQESAQDIYCSEVVDLWTFSSNHGSSSNSSSDPLAQLSV